MLGTVWLTVHWFQRRGSRVHAGFFPKWKSFGVKHSSVEEMGITNTHMCKLLHSRVQKFEVAVLGSPPLIVLMVPVDVKHH